MTDRNATGVLARSPLLSYVALAYLFSWSLGLPLLFSRRGWVGLEIGEHWEAAAAFGPLLAALVVARSSGGSRAVAELVRGMGRWRVGGGWLLFSIGSPVALLGAAALLVRVATGAWPDLAPLADGRLASASGIAGLVVVSGLVQGVGEEPGWRGFMLPRLLERYGLLAATLVLWPVWLFWHLPAFLGRPEFGPAQGLGFALGVLSAAMWLTLIYTRTASTLMAIAWHTMINITRGIAIAISPSMFLAMSTLVLIGGIAIAVSWLVGRRGLPVTPDPV